MAFRFSPALPILEHVWDTGPHGRSLSGRTAGPPSAACGPPPAGVHVSLPLPSVSVVTPFLLLVEVFLNKCFVNECGHYAFIIWYYSPCLLRSFSAI